jgi:2-oxoglutarate ferredoxin oxidoreductase subunit delta
MTDKFWRKPLDEKEYERPRGRIYTIPDRCKGCGFCIEFCPRQVLKFSEEFNKRGVHPPEVEKPEECIMCGLCEHICPDFAIYCLDSNEPETDLPEGVRDQMAENEKKKKGGAKVDG